MFIGTQTIVHIYARSRSEGHGHYRGRIERRWHPKKLVFTNMNDSCVTSRRQWLMRSPHVIRTHCKTARQVPGSFMPECTWLMTSFVAGVWNERGQMDSNSLLTLIWLQSELINSLVFLCDEWRCHRENNNRRRETHSTEIVVYTRAPGAKLCVNRFVL